MTDKQDDLLSIGQASEEINLPESTIRYYDKEFSDFLDIPRGKNNQRLFSDSNLKDLEYIRYLIKREEMSIEEVRERLEREENYSQSAEENDARFQDQPKASESTKEGTRKEKSVSASDDSLDSRIEELLGRLDDLEERMITLRENQEKIMELLDLNLQRYNQMVEDL
jgi:DNA-binding transcriptional MerR regulator